MFKDSGLDALICDNYVDAHFISYLEYKNPKKCRFVRIDAEIDEVLKSENSDSDGEAIVELFKNVLGENRVEIKAEKLKNAKIPAIINANEFMRRMSEINGFYGMEETDTMKNASLIVNLTNPVVSSLLIQSQDKQEKIVKQIYYLALLSYKKLSPEELAEFVNISGDLLFEYSK